MSFGNLLTIKNIKLLNLLKNDFVFNVDSNSNKHFLFNSGNYYFTLMLQMLKK